MNLNVFNWAYTARYYLTHPWKWVSELIGIIKDAFHRMKYGWCYTDVWNWNDWFCSVVPPMLRAIADEGVAYPGGEPFDTPEKWHDWLYEMAECIENIQCDTWFDNNNEYAEEYYQSLEDKFFEKENPNQQLTMTNKRSHEEIRELYFNKMKEISKMRQQALEDFGKEFFKYFDCLWD